MGYKFVIFKQTASHLPFEANVERAFTVAGYLSDPCRHAEHLIGDMAMAAVNRKAYGPSIEAIRDVPRHCRSSICGCGLGFGLEHSVVVRRQLIDFGLEQLVFIWT